MKQRLLALGILVPFLFFLSLFCVPLASAHPLGTRAACSDAQPGRIHLSQHDDGSPVALLLKVTLDACAMTLLAHGSDAHALQVVSDDGSVSVGGGLDWAVIESVNLLAPRLVAQAKNCPGGAVTWMIPMTKPQVGAVVPG